MSATISGALISQPTTQNLIPREGPKSIPIVLPFTSSATAFALDFSQVIQQGKIATINGLFVDNSANSASVTFQVQGSGQNIICPPQSQGIFPVIGPELLRMTALSTGQSNVVIQCLNTTPTIAVWSVLQGSGSMGVTSVSTGAGLSGGPITTTGTIIADWRAGTVSALGTGLSFVGTVLTPNVASAGNGLSLSSGVLSDVSSVTRTPAASTTQNIDPASGVSDFIVQMPSGGGTVTFNAVPTFTDQRVLLTVIQGATAGTVTLNSTFKFATTGGPTSYTATASAAAIDRLQLYSPDGTNWVVLAVGNGYPV